jgi:poly(3-hydroxybutyrate) depolymerase
MPKAIALLFVLLAAVGPACVPGAEGSPNRPGDKDTAADETGQEGEGDPAEGEGEGEASEGESEGGEGEGEGEVDPQDRDGDGVENDDDEAPDDPCVPGPEALSCPSGDLDFDGADNASDIDPLDPCVPSTDVLSCPTGDLDGDGVPNADDTNSANPCIPPNTSLLCPTNDSDGDGVLNELDPDPLDACTPDAGSATCPGGDFDNDGSDNGSDPDPADPCVPTLAILGCDRGDADGDGIDNGSDPHDEDPCLPAQTPDALACATGDTDDDGVENGVDVDVETGTPAALDPCVPTVAVLACPAGDADADGIDNGSDPHDDDPCLPAQTPDALACTTGDTDDDGVENGVDVDAETGTPAALDPCVPSDAALACPSGDADADGIDNGSDTHDEDPCLPVQTPDALVCATGDTDDDGVENGVDVDAETGTPAALDPCVPSDAALACPTGDADADGIDNGSDPADDDACLPEPHGLACPTGDTDRDGVNNGEDDDALDPCVPDGVHARCLGLSPGCGQEPLVASDFFDEGGTGEKTLVVQGILRDAAIRLPANYDDDHPYPLVFEFHGDQGLREDQTPEPLVPASFGAGIFGAGTYDDQAIVVALHGINRLAPEVRADFQNFVAWNTLSRDDENHDILALRAFREFISARACVDPQKTFAAGFSRGAFFTQSLRCFDEDLTAVATFAGGLEGQPFPAAASDVDHAHLRDNDGQLLRLDPATCASSLVPQLLVRGVHDLVVPLEQMSFVATLWAERNGCGPLSDTASTLDSECVESLDCDEGAAVVVCSPNGIAHEVWSSPVASDVDDRGGTAVLKAFFHRFF